MTINHDDVKLFEISRIDRTIGDEALRKAFIGISHMPDRELGRIMPTASLKYRLPEYQTLVH
ncbi:hypothetical protein [Salinisphaera sp. G21_0]|uniref:hypothetical protein n=1 Tax=Salinisphaera sp. G21_0 TaxID=2821094 RepID=UPI001AD9687E|nr:hypothetical protein [Salinisphaera sp. G21_0]MBO9482336.1 hypothetical protein [Salinisphaera sp. G21_0]